MVPPPIPSPDKDPSSFTPEDERKNKLETIWLIAIFGIILIGFTVVYFSQVY